MPVICAPLLTIPQEPFPLLMWSPVVFSLENDIAACPSLGLGRGCSWGCRPLTCSSAQPPSSLGGLCPVNQPYIPLHPGLMAPPTSHFTEVRMSSSGKVTDMNLECHQMRVVCIESWACSERAPGLVLGLVCPLSGPHCDEGRPFPPGHNQNRGSACMEPATSTDAIFVPS